MIQHSPFGKARFCPQCGLENIKRDDYHGPIGDGFRPEYVCEICGFGFALIPSTRYACAQALFRKHRKLGVRLYGNQTQALKREPPLSGEEAKKQREAEDLAATEFTIPCFVKTHLLVRPNGSGLCANATEIPGLVVAGLNREELRMAAGRIIKAKLQLGAWTV